MNHVHDLCLQLWHHEWVSESDDPKEFPDPTMCFMALVHLKEGGEFAEPKDVTQPIAKFTWSIRMTTIFEIHDGVKKGIYPNQHSAMLALRKWVVEKEMTTFSALRSLTHYASSLAYNTLSHPLCFWIDHDNYSALRYKGQLITEEHIISIFGSLQKEMVDLWQNNILLGTGHRVVYESLADDLANNTPGYSFLDDPDNGLMGHFDDLLTVFSKDQDIRKLMFVEEEGGEINFNLLAWRKWLADLAKFENLLLVGVDMMGGSPPRGTELTATMVRNTPFRSRNMRALGNYLAIVRQYSKTTNNQQQDKIIPHAMDAFCSDIFIQLHVLARPIAQVKIILPQLCKINSLPFQVYGNPNQHQ